MNENLKSRKQKNMQKICLSSIKKQLNITQRYHSQSIKYTWTRWQNWFKIKSF